MFGKILRIIFPLSLAPVLLAAQSIRVSLPADTTAETATSIDIPVRVGDLTDRGIFSYQASITFDENVLDATGARSTGTLTENFGPPIANLAEIGRIQIGGFGTAPLAGSGVLVYLTFQVAGQPGDTTSIKFQSFYFNSGEPSVTAQNGKLTVAFPTGVLQAERPPGNFQLLQNYPNPFNPATRIRFILPEQRIVALEIYNLAGKSILRLGEQEYAAGEHTVTWDGRDQNGQKVESGIYWCRLRAGELVLVRKMVLIK